MPPPRGVCGVAASPVGAGSQPAGTAGNAQAYNIQPVMPGYAYCPQRSMQATGFVKGRERPVRGAEKKKPRV